MLKPEARECVQFKAELDRALLEGRGEFLYLHIPNEFAGKQRKVFGALLLAMGVFPGAADYLIANHNRFMFIEFKAGKNKQNDNQKTFQHWCDAVGIEYYVMYTWQEAIELLTLHNFIGGKNAKS